MFKNNNKIFLYILFLEIKNIDLKNSMHPKFVYLIRFSNEEFNA
jgi:hypothetical protein